MDSSDQLPFPRTELALNTTRFVRGIEDPAIFNHSMQGFDLDGADLAARFLTEQGAPSERVEIVWDATALHRCYEVAMRSTIRYSGRTRSPKDPGDLAYLGTADDPITQLERLRRLSADDMNPSRPTTQRKPSHAR